MGVAMASAPPLLNTTVPQSWPAFAGPIGTQIGQELGLGFGALWSQRGSHFQWRASTAHLEQGSRGTTGLGSPLPHEPSDFVKRMVANMIRKAMSSRNMIGATFVVVVDSRYMPEIQSCQTDRVAPPRAQRTR